ncbi:MAG: hypothetical protein NXH85_07345 [Pseudomonadaceae bacterium]|nr:hypothetical protein [Pseudomonadaceae bacterium]
MSATSFDLIPESYRVQQRTKKRLRIMSAGALAIGLACVSVWGYLSWLTSSLNTEIAELERKQTLSRQQQTQLAALNDDLAGLQRRWHLLEGLRSGMPAATVMSSVENALPADEVWFTQWRFLRAGIVTEKQPDPQPPSYFIRLDSAEPIDAWRALTHMRISGQARDHAALSDFARALLNQPGVADVAVQRTSTKQARSDEPRLINFELAVHIRADVSNT